MSVDEDSIMTLALSKMQEQEKLAMAKTILICLYEGGINLSVFEEFAPCEWRRELLTFTLLRKLNLCDMEAAQFIAKINCIDDLLNNTIYWTTEDVLETLVCHKGGCKMNAQFLNDLFYIIPKQPDIVACFSENFSGIKSQVKKFKLNKIIATSDIHSSNSILESTLKQLLYTLVKYPVEIIYNVCSKITNNNLNETITFLKILQCSDIDFTDKVKFLLRLQQNDNMTEWVDKLSFEIVGRFISNVFPLYESHGYQKNYELKDKETLYKIYSPLAKENKKTDRICSCQNEEKSCKLHKSKDCNDVLYVLHCSLTHILSNCKEPSEMLNMIVEIIVSINKEQKIAQVIHALHTLQEYDSLCFDKALQNSLSKFTSKNCEDKIHKYTIQNSFCETYEKSVDELIEEIHSLNGKSTDSLVTQFSNIKKAYKNKSKLFPKGNRIKSWKQPEIKAWAKLVRKRDLVSDEEIIAVIKRAAKTIKSLKLRHIQLLSVLCTITCAKEKGRLLQVNTGEGKTLVIAIIAAYYALKGHQVDVYTSSPLLAIPQSEEFRDFYKIFGITVNHNIFHALVYDCDVIYGTTTSFQGDVLRDEFRKTGIRMGRKFDVAIIDEVDNMLIDGNNWILMLSCDMPGMDYLEPLLAAIYIQVNAVASMMTERNGKVYYLEQENAIDEDGNVKPEVIVHEREIQDTKTNFITKCVDTHIRKLIRDTDSGLEIEEDYNEIKIPKHLREVICKTKLKKWIHRAIAAVFHYVQGEDYILKDGKITIVDTSNTGVMKKNSHWSHGLHQFLQIKHGARIEPESFTTNYISNVGLFNRYSSKLFGLTGTLGSDGTKGFLQKTYDVDTLIIPPFKLKRHKHLEPVIVSNEDMWYLEIAKNSIRKLRSGRAVLIIMNFIRETEKLAEIFEKSFDYEKSKIKLYRTDDDSKVVESALKSGDVIITTNIAGRGTDIELDQNVEDNGGLHVCLTFLPVNSRVEEQNIGRTSRKGNRGTSQFILYDSQGSSIQNLKEIRTRRENAAISGATEQVKKTKTKDKIFQKFCKLLGKIEGVNSSVNKIYRTAVEERFAIWLEANEDHFDKKSKKDILQDFKLFTDEILNDKRNGELIKNPCMFIEMGNKYLKVKRFDDAINEYTSAIILDRNFGEHAYYNRAWALLSKYGKNLKKNKHFINEAISDFRKARKLIEEKEYGFHLLQHASKGEVFLQQISHKVNLYNLQKNIIETAIGPDIEAINEQITSLKKQSKENISQEEKDKISEIIENLVKRKENIGVIGRAKQNQRDIKIESLTDDEFMPKSDRESHRDEIEEFESNGWIRGFKISEVKPINWGAVVGLLGIGLGQLIMGAALTVFTLGAGASLGLGLISEGVSDMITAVKAGIISREFEWATWAIQKVISVAVSIIFAGFKAIKDVARTAYAGARNVVVSGTKAFTETAKEGWRLVAKKIGFDLAKGVAKEIVTDLVNFGIDKTLIPFIQEKIIELVRDPIQDALTHNPKVKQMLELDEKNGNHNYENHIRSLGLKILSPEKNSMLFNIAVQIATRVANENKKLTTALQIGTALKGIYDLATFTSDFIQKLNDSIDKVKIKEETKISNNQKDDAQANIQRDGKKGDDINLNKVNQPEEQIQLQKKKCTTDNLSDEFASTVSANMTNIIKEKITSPAIRFGANYTVEKFCSKITTSLNEQTHEYRVFKNVLHYQNAGYKNTKKSQPDNSDESDIHKIDQIIKDLESGEPGGLLHLGAISDAVNRPIEVYDEKGRLKYIIGDSKKGKPVQIQYFPPGKDREHGHFTLKGNRDPVNAGEGNNMCLFNVVAHQTHQNPNDLKTSTLDIMKNNKSTMAKQVKFIKQMEVHLNPRLLQGGAKYHGENPDDAADLIKKSDGSKGYGHCNKGHPLIHVPFKGKTEVRLKALSQKLKRKIEIYDENGNKTSTIGDEHDGEPIKLQHHKPEGDTSGEYFTAIGGQENYRFQHPNDMIFYDIVSKQTGGDKTADDVKSATLAGVEDQEIPKRTSCIELGSLNGEKHGFISDAEQAFVVHHALKSGIAQKKLAELNKHIGNPSNPEICKRVTVYVSAKELNLPREAFASKWVNGKPQKPYPVKEVRLVLQHFEGKENDLEAPVQIFTCFPERET